MGQVFGFVISTEFLVVADLPFLRLYVSLFANRLVVDVLDIRVAVMVEVFSDASVFVDPVFHLSVCLECEDFTILNH